MSKSRPVGPHASKVLAWAAGKGRAFTAIEVMRAFGVTETPAKGVLSDLVRDQHLALEPQPKGLAVKYRVQA